MSDINQAKEKKQEIEAKLTNQKVYEKLKEEERLKLFQDYLLYDAQSNEAYHAKENEYEEKVKSQINTLNDNLSVLAKAKLGSDALMLLNDTYPKSEIFRGTILPEQRTSTNHRWHRTIDDLMNLDEEYLKSRQKFDSCLEKNDIKEFVNLTEALFNRINEEGIKRKYSQKDRADIDNLTEEEKITVQMREAYSNSIKNRIKIEPKQVNINGEMKMVFSLTPESVQIIKAISNEFADRHTSMVLDAMKKSEKMTEKLANANIPEIELLKDDPKFMRKLGEKLVRYQDPVGRKITNNFMAIKVFGMSMQMLSSESFNIDGKNAPGYPADTVFNSLYEELKKTGSKLVNPKNNDEKMDYEETISGWIGESSPDLNGFVVKEGIIPEGESVFYKVPELHKNISKMTDYQISVKEFSMREQQNRSDELKNQTIINMKEEANQLIREMNSLNPKPQETDAYRDFKDSLINITRLGTPEFIIRKSGNSANPICYKTEKTGKIQLVQGCLLVKNAVANYNKELQNKEKEGIKPDKNILQFAKKIETFAWEKNINVSKIPDAIDEKTFALFQKAKSARGIKDAEITERLRVNVKEDPFTKEVQKAMKEYMQSAKLHRCSSEFKKVEKEMDAFLVKYNKMLQIEKEMHDYKKPYEPECNKKLLKATLDVQKAAAKVRKANNDYFIHKQKDKHWGTDAPEYSQKRISAVKGLDFSFSWFEKTLEKKLDYIMDDATVYGFYDVQRRNVVRKLQKENIPDLNKVAQYAVRSMDRLCKIPNWQSTRPLNEKELNVYKYDIATIVLADYANTERGKKYLEDIKQKNEVSLRNLKDFQKIVKAVGDSDAFMKTLPKDLSPSNLLSMAISQSALHDIRSRFETNLRAEKNKQKENNNMKEMNKKEVNEINKDNKVIKPSGPSFH